MATNLISLGGMVEEARQWIMLWLTIYSGIMEDLQDKYLGTKLLCINLLSGNESIDTAWCKSHVTGYAALESSFRKRLLPRWGQKGLQGEEREVYRVRRGRSAGWGEGGLQGEEREVCRVRRGRSAGWGEGGLSSPCCRWFGPVSLWIL